MAFLNFMVLLAGKSGSSDDPGPLIIQVIWIGECLEKKVEKKGILVTCGQAQKTSAPNVKCIFFPRQMESVLSVSWHYMLPSFLIFLCLELNYTML